MLTYRDEFQVGTRVMVEAGPDAGTDHEFNGCTGTIVRGAGGWLAVQIDKLPCYWKNPAILCLHNLRRIHSSTAHSTEGTK